VLHLQGWLSTCSPWAWFIFHIVGLNLFPCCHLFGCRWLASFAVCNRILAFKEINLVYLNGASLCESSFLGTSQGFLCLSHIKGSNFRHSRDCWYYNSRLGWTDWERGRVFIPESFPLCSSLG
jgi:hypothetical protein